MRRHGVRSPFVSVGWTGIRKAGAGVGSLVNGQTTIESFAFTCGLFAMASKSRCAWRLKALPRTSGTHGACPASAGARGGRG